MVVALGVGLWRRLGVECKINNRWGAGLGRGLDIGCGVSVPVERTTSTIKYQHRKHKSLEVAMNHHF